MSALQEKFDQLFSYTLKPGFDTSACSQLIAYLIENKPVNLKDPYIKQLLNTLSRMQTIHSPDILVLYVDTVLSELLFDVARSILYPNLQGHEKSMQLVADILKLIEDTMLELENFLSISQKDPLYDVVFSSLQNIETICLIYQKGKEDTETK